MPPTHQFLGVHRCTDHPVMALASAGIISLKRQRVLADHHGVVFSDLGTVLETWRWILMHMAQLLQQVSQKQHMLFITIKLQLLPCASAMMIQDASGRFSSGGLTELLNKIPHRLWIASFGLSNTHMNANSTLRPWVDCVGHGVFGCLIADACLRRLGRGLRCTVRCTLFRTASETITA